MLKAILNFNQRNIWWQSIKNISLRYRKARNKAILAAAAVLGLHLNAQAQHFDTVQVNPWGINIPADSTGTTPQYFVTTGDLDADGDVDMLTSSPYGNAGFQFWQNVGSASVPAFDTTVNNPFGYPLADSTVTPVALNLVDLDNDGDLDLLQTGFSTSTYSGTMRYVRNIGTTTVPQFDTAVINPFGFTLPAFGIPFSLTNADMDNDGDQDALIGVYGVYGLATSGIYYYPNRGTATTPLFDTVMVNPFGITNVPSQSLVSSGDLDDDGDVDILLGSYGSADFSFYANTGTATVPQFDTAMVNPFGLAAAPLEAGYIPVLVDMDNDGDLDVLASSIPDSLATGSNFYFFEDTTSHNATQIVQLQSKNWNLTLMPNPVQNELTINIQALAINEEDLQVMITNALGEVVKTHVVRLAETTTLTYPLNHLSSGVYQITLSNGKSRLTKQFIKL